MLAVRQQPPHCCVKLACSSPLPAPAAPWRALRLQPSHYQRLTVAHMLEKERQGAAANLWVQLTPPGRTGAGLLARRSCKTPA